MQSDDEIAQSATLTPITEVAANLGIEECALIPFGRNKAKIDPESTASIRARVDGKLILVTAMTPTQRGEGKTTLAIGLGDGLNRLGRKTAVCLREPSLGPCFGSKGGATGAGHAQVAPRDEINLHFTGDFHAVAAANNLLAAMVDNHLYRRKAPVLDPTRIAWRRAIDMNDRALRKITVGVSSVPRSDGFDIVPACEVMAVLCLARDRSDLEARLARMIVGYTHDARPVTAADIGACGAMSALLRDALAPNLVQSLENNPVLIHGGPFANIAHGCNSVIATRLALSLADYVVTEAGFGADLGAEKFFDIKCRQAGLVPAAAVVVATIASLKAHGGVAASDLASENLGAVHLGLPNLLRHLQIVHRYGVPAVVAINRYAGDSEAELLAVCDAVRDAGVPAVVSEHWRDGGAGAESLAAQVAEVADHDGSRFQLLYDDDTALQKKLETIVTQIYGASGVTMEDSVRAELERLQSSGYGQLPICVAKTPQSLSADKHRTGVPVGFTIPIRELRLSAGAGFIVAFAGKVLTMPGLPSQPSAADIHVNDQGAIEGLR